MGIKRKWRCSAFAALLVLAAFWGTGIRCRAAAMDKLTVKIGYYGWPVRDYLTKAEFSWRDLADMGLEEEAYTYFSGTQAAIDSARGVPLVDVMEQAGIDLSSVRQMDFYTADQENGAFQSFTYQDLLGTRRYYFKNLAACLSYNSENKVVADDSVWDSARRVQPMLALEENWTWYEFGTENAEPNYTSLTTANRFRLLFGQSGPTEFRTFASAKMVHTVYIMFAGSPKLSSKNSDLKVKVGSDQRLTVQVDAQDEKLAEYIKKNLQWKSSDQQVVTVDKDGKLHFKSKGTATITASYGDTDTTFHITVSDDEADESKETVTPKNEGTSGDTGSKADKKDKETGAGRGTGTGSGNGDGKSADSKASSSSKGGSLFEDKKVRKNVSSTGMFVLSEGARQRLEALQGKVKTGAGEGGEDMQRAKRSEMNSDARQLVVKLEENPALRITFITLFVVFVLGLLTGLLKYHIQK